MCGIDNAGLHIKALDEWTIHCNLCGCNFHCREVLRLEAVEKNVLSKEHVKLLALEKGEFIICVNYFFSFFFVVILLLWLYLKIKLNFNRGTQIMYFLEFFWTFQMYSLLRTKYSLILGVKRLTKTAKRRLHKLVLLILLHVVPIKGNIQVNPGNEIIVNVKKALLFNWVIFHMHAAIC